MVVVALVCLAIYLGRNYIILLWLYSYIFFYQRVDTTTFVPVVLDTKIFLIPIQRRKQRYHIVDDDGLSENEKKSLDFLCKYTTKLSSSKTIQVVDMTNFEDKTLHISDI